MPFPNEHAARIKSPGQFTSFARKALPGVSGIDQVLGIKDGVSETQALRFDKSKWTVAEARAWLRAHPRFKVMSFEPAKKGDFR
jgi:hypothetical protein